MDDDGWSELPTDLIENIARRLPVYADYVRLRAVCLKWCSSLPPRPQYLVKQFPWLMLSPESTYGEHHGFYNLFENKVHRLNMPTDRPWKRCCGSSHGWLVLLEERGPAILLFNPITSIQIQLPPITTFPSVLDYDINKVGEEYLLRSPFGENPKRHSMDDIRDTFIKKLVLSTSPTSLDEDYIAVAIVDIAGELAYCKKGDEGWTTIGNSMYSDDVIYYEGVFYAVNNNRGSFATFDVTNPYQSMKRIIQPSPVYGRDLDYCDKLYLVDSFGELLRVHRFRSFRVIDRGYVVYYTIRFEVIRLNSSRTEWVEVKSLGDRMLFLGTNSSLCLLATDFSGLEGNCIYFTGETNNFGDSHLFFNNDSGVFNLEDGSIKPLPNCINLEDGCVKPLPYCTSKKSLFLPTPVWLTPNP